MEYLEGPVGYFNSVYSTYQQQQQQESDNIVDQLADAVNINQNNNNNKKNQVASISQDTKLEQKCKQIWEGAMAYSEFYIEDMDTDYDTLYKETNFKKKLKLKEEELKFKNLVKEAQNKGKGEIVFEKKEKLWSTNINQQ